MGPWVRDLYLGFIISVERWAVTEIVNLFQLVQPHLFSGAEALQPGVQF